MAEFRASSGAPAISTQKLPGDTTIDEVALAFWNFAQGHYKRADGTTTNELVEYKYTFRVLRPLYGVSPAVEFGPRALKTFRQAMIDRGWNRNVTNNRIRRLKHVFKWASGEELVPVTTCTALATVTRLQKGRSSAVEPEPISPVAIDHVTAILPELPRPVYGLVLFCLYSGCRPGEACALRPVDLDQTSSVWLFKPGQHKNVHRGKKRVIAVGPRAQTVLAQFCPATPTDYFFSPRLAVAEMRAARSLARHPRVTRRT